MRNGGGGRPTARTTRETPKLLQGKKKDEKFNLQEKINSYKIEKLN